MLDPSQRAATPVSGIEHPVHGHKTDKSERLAALNAELTTVESMHARLRGMHKHHEVVSFALDEDLARRQAWRPVSRLSFLIYQSLGRGVGAGEGGTQGHRSGVGTGEASRCPD